MPDDTFQVDLSVHEEYGSALSYDPAVDTDAEEMVRFNLKVSEMKMLQNGDSRPWVYGPTVEHLPFKGHPGLMVCRWYGVKEKAVA